eukprot:3327583-Prymnesium_polylepis.1
MSPCVCTARVRAYCARSGVPRARSLVGVAAAREVRQRRAKARAHVMRQNAAAGLARRLWGRIGAEEGDDIRRAEVRQRVRARRVRRVRGRQRGALR